MKDLLKKLARSAAVLLVSPLLVTYGIFRLAGSHMAIAGFSQCLSLVPGKLGSFVRVAFFRFTLNDCHRDCRIGFGTLFSQVDTDIAKGVYIGPQCNIGSCGIGRNTLIASGVHVMSGSEQHGTAQLDTPIQEQQGNYRKIAIGEDSWIGNGSLVMADVGKQCIVGAGSVVTKAIPDFSIVAGNPARLVRMRNE